MYNNDTVSVITISYNAEFEIERTILSVINQDFKHLEYIIIDGGSTDGTMTIVNRYVDKINIIVSEPDRGIYDAMNKGVNIASGEWLIMMNAGDCFASNSVLREIFERGVPLDKSFIYSDTYGLRKDGSWVVRPMSFENGKLIHQSIIYRKKLHEEHGLYIVTKPIIISDYLFFIRVPEKEVIKVDTVISVYEGGGVSAQGVWSLQQSICADVVFRRRTFWGMISFYVWKRIKSIVPVEAKDKIKSMLYKKDK